MVAFLLGAPAHADSEADFLSAREAWAAGDMRRFSLAAERVPADSALYPYIAYWRLARKLEDDSTIADFLVRYRDTWLAEQLRGNWLKDLGRRELWSAYLAEYQKLASPDVSHECLARRAEMALGDSRRIKEAMGIWFSGRDRPAVCTPMFSWLLEQGYLGEEEVWKRLRLAFEAGNRGVAKAVANALPEGRRPASSSIERAYRNPEAWLASEPIAWEDRAQREVALFALHRLARKDTVQAARTLEPILTRLSTADQQYIWGLFALEAARSHEPQALPWFELSGGVGLSDEQREWWARAAMRGGDWPAVQRAIQGMSDETRNQSTWKYWLARALKANGQTFAANQFFAPLSREHHYYGQLAAEELGMVMGSQPANYKASQEEVAAVSANAGIARALALNALGLRTEATNEWIWAVRDFNDRQLLAAAELARRNEWYDRAINTAERTRQLHDFDMRFLAPYRELATKEARENGLDEAWVFGLIRQESRFINVARSHVGASGLMQIMPATGRWIANRLGIRGFKTSSLNEPETNIKFGSYYLRYVQDSLAGHPVLATAAYNAGPRRAQRWRDSKPMEGAVYVESIPFTETRRYVQKVMSNAMYYARRFDQPSVLLRDRLGVIPPSATPAAPRNANDNQPNMDDKDDES